MVFGGAYQGKRAFAKTLLAERKERAGRKEFAEREARAAITIYEYGEGDGASGPQNPIAQDPEFTADIISGLEKFVWNCCGEEPEQRIEAADRMRELRSLWQDRILVMTDVSQGIVPMDARTRAYREMNGRMMLYLASEAEEVWRVFCGIGRRIR